jgi:serine/threonine protein kinase
MEYANDGDLLSYLNRNINKLTWDMKLSLLRGIADSLEVIHDNNMVHCDLHGGNIVLHKSDPTNIASTARICDLSLSCSTKFESVSNIEGTRKFTKASDVYAFGLIMYLVASGEPPFRDRLFDKDLACDIIGGLRPTMPDSTPGEYKKLAEKCYDADPSKRPIILEICSEIYSLLENGRNG